MKKPKRKLKPNKLPRKLKGWSLKHDKTADEKVSQAISDVPRITNDTVTDHREDVLASARKYIYPLQHSKHRIVRTSIGLLILVIVSFLAVCGLDLYKFQGTSGFIYDVTKILPFPVAKVGSNWVSYESYLFELRRNMHYYVTQQQANFSTADGKAQLVHLKQQAMNEVIQNTFVKQLASQNNVHVSDQAVSNEVNLLKTENRLGSSDHVFKEVLSEYWGWTEQDFKRELKEQMLSQAVVTKLDTAVTTKAQAALKQLQTGTDFATLASQISEDPSTKGNGGQYPSAITIEDSEISPVITATLFQLKPGQISGIINTGYSLDIVKLIDSNGSSVHAAHIQFNLTNINTYITPLAKTEAIHKYIKV